jgi:microcystin-dependent protein
MPRIIQQRRGSTSGISSILGAAGELFVDTSLVTVVVHDGVTTGGTTLATQSYAQNATPVATSSTLGKVRPDGTSVLINSGVISIQAFVTGMIMMWSGSIATIPSGWSLCNGSAGTPDLRDKFVVGAGTLYNPGDAGGTSDAIVVSHSHTITDPGHKHTYTTPSGTQNTLSGTPSTNPFTGTASTQTTVTSTGITVDTAGQSGTNKNLPPYYALAYIMKL